MTDSKVCILCFGAHPDDCDLRCGGMALLWRNMGHQVKFVSMTNGDTGHHEMGGGPLARRRYQETQCSAQIADIEYEVYDIHNGQLVPNLFYRRKTIKTIREFAPDVVICHRSNDYHPDHRAVGVLVQDAVFSVTIPNVVALTPPMDAPPVLGYAYDYFTEPTAYEPTVAVSTDDVWERKLQMIHCHESQMYEWLARDTEVPEDEKGRKKFLRQRMDARFETVAERFRDGLQKWYGDQEATHVRTAETVMISEYGTVPSDDDDIRRLFPFLP